MYKIRCSYLISMQYKQIIKKKYAYNMLDHSINCLQKDGEIQKSCTRIWLQFLE